MPRPTRTDTLTEDERMAWHDEDSVSFYEWYVRWLHIEMSESLGNKVPRHRYNKKYPHMP